MGSPLRIPVKGVEVTIFSAVVASREAIAPDSGIQPRDSQLQFWDESHHMLVEVNLWRNDRDAAGQLRAAASRGGMLLVVGDPTEPGTSGDGSQCSNAVLIDIDFREGQARATSSLIGLPPIVTCTTAEHASLSCPFLPRQSTGSHRVDLEGIADTLRWGHPLDGRTLFTNVRIVPAAATVSLGLDGQFVVKLPSSEQPDPAQLSLGWDALIEEQIAALERAAARLPTSGAFLSLSGGLDSRTALLALLRQGHSIQCVSMAGSSTSLDARLARRFCSAHGLPHQIIEIAGDFLANLPEAAVRAASLTGGVACLSQTIDLYLYANVANHPTIRISGNLGNQVGRGGVESLSASRPRKEIFSRELAGALQERPIAPWFISQWRPCRSARCSFHRKSITGPLPTTCWGAPLPCS